MISIQPTRFQDTIPIAHTPSVSIIIPTVHLRQRMSLPLDALRRDDEFEGEIIVVSNGAPAGECRWLCEQYPEVRLIVCKKNIGFAAACNLGMINARGKISVLLNDDTEPEPGWLGPIEETFKSDPTIGIIGCRLLFPDRQTIQHSGGVTEQNGLTTHLDYKKPIDEAEICELQDVDYVTGAAVAIRSSVLRKVGLLDESFFPAYYEENDLCQRAKAAGYRVAIQPLSVVIHHESQTSGQNSRRYLTMYHRNRWKFLLRHRKGTEMFSAIKAECKWLTRHRLWDLLIPLSLAYSEAITDFAVRSQRRGRRS